MTAGIGDSTQVQSEWTGGCVYSTFELKLVEGQNFCGLVRTDCCHESTENRMGRVQMTCVYSLSLFMEHMGG